MFVKPAFLRSFLGKLLQRSTQQRILQTNLLQVYLRTTWFLLKRDSISTKYRYAKSYIIPVQSESFINNSFLVDNLEFISHTYCKSCLIESAQCTVYSCASRSVENWACLVKIIRSEVSFLLMNRRRLRACLQFVRCLRGNIKNHCCL